MIFKIMKLRILILRYMLESPEELLQITDF